MLPTGDPSRGRVAAGPFTREGLAIASLTFVATLLVVFACQLFVAATFLPTGLAFVPGALFGGADLPPQFPVIPPPVTLVTHQFLHAGWFHLLGNLLILLVFGPRVEQAIGPGPWTVLLLSSGIGAALVQAWLDPASPVAVVGASGAVAGILGASMALRAIADIRLSAWMVLAGWMLMQALHLYFAGTHPGGMNLRAQFGGFACGLLLAPVLHFLSLLSADARDVAGPPRSRDSGH